MNEKVSILMATYRPESLFLKKQLNSIREQTYKNIELIIIDDSDCISSFNLIKEIVESELINSIPVKLLKNEKNLGSNKTFEKLTMLATGKYIAYCDQDDIWEKDKIYTLLSKILEENSVICYSDLSIINEDDIEIAKSFKDISKRLEHKFGIDTYKYFIRRNSITGCTMLIKREIALKSLPFPDYKIYVHDHWLALYGSLYGRVSYIKKPLVKYRIHQNNQIGAKVLSNIYDKFDYYEKKLLVEEAKIQLIYSRNLPHINLGLNSVLISSSKFVNIRKSLFERKTLNNIIKFVNILHFDPLLIVFEGIICFAPNNIVKKLLKNIK